MVILRRPEGPRRMRGRACELKILEVLLAWIVVIPSRNLRSKFRIDGTPDLNTRRPSVIPSSPRAFPQNGAGRTEERTQDHSRKKRERTESRHAKLTCQTSLGERGNLMIKRKQHVSHFLMLPAPQRYLPILRFSNMHLPDINFPLFIFKIAQ